MIVIFHKNNKVDHIYDYSLNLDLEVKGNTIQEILLTIADKNNTQFIGWCHYSLKEHLNFEGCASTLKNQLYMVSYETSSNYFISTSIGYVEATPFIKVNKEVKYPTWLMSSDVGVIHACVLLKFKQLLNYKLSFNFFLNTISKSGTKQGLLCYSTPHLLKDSFREKVVNKEVISTFNFMWFVKSNYRFRWVMLYMFNLLLFQKKLPIRSLLRVFFKKSIKNSISFSDITLVQNNDTQMPSIDVLIPTLERDKYLKDVLKDLSKQTLLPIKVIIVEQSINKKGRSKLDFLSNKWPFEVEHTLTNQLGVCNARNIALEKVTSDWVFFADDDIRFENTFLEDAFNYINLYNANAVSLGCLQKNEIEKQKFIFQSAIFGSGTSIVNSKSLDNVKFDLSYEFGYGEDADFGMQLRRIGTDILYIPFVSMLHLKAPIGGFRNIIKREWDLDTFLPKPSPTIMVFKIKYSTKEQIQSYQTMLFLTFYRNQPIKNPISYFRIMKKAWGRSKYWANYLIKKYSDDKI